MKLFLCSAHCLWPTTHLCHSIFSPTFVGPLPLTFTLHLILDLHPRARDFASAISCLNCPPHSCPFL